MMIMMTMTLMKKVMMMMMIEWHDEEHLALVDVFSVFSKERLKFKGSKERRLRY